MKRSGEVLHYGTGEIASLAARCRSSNNYYVAAMLESQFGERRAWDEVGRTMFATFPSPWLMDQDRRCADRYIEAAYSWPVVAVREEK